MSPRNSPSPEYDLAVVLSHPIQYYSPIFRELAKRIRLRVFYCHDLKPEERLATGIGREFSWDVPLLDGYEWEYLRNVSSHPGVHSFFGCNAPDLFKILRAERYRSVMVGGWQLYAYCQAMIAAKRHGVKLLVRGDSQRPGGRRFWKRVAKRAVYSLAAAQIDAFLAVGQRAAEYYRYYGGKPEKIYFVPHCVDNRWWSERAESAQQRITALRSKWNLPAGPTTFLFVGRFIPMKRPVDLARAFLEARRSADLRLVYVGDGTLKSAVADVVRDSPDVSFVGFQNQSALPELYALGDALVLPSDAGETWGLVVNEAFASGVPAVVSDEVGSAPDLIDNGLTGLTFNGGDITALRDALLDFDRLKRTGFEFGTHLRLKINRYSVENAVVGICSAIST